jgi:hypothetical protein
MISSQDGTEDRRPRAALRLWRVGCSPTASPWAAAAAAGAESPPAEGAGVSWRA